NQINFSQGVGIGSNVAVSQLPLKIFQCPSDSNLQSVILWDSNFTPPIATVAHGNYVACNGWEECFNGASGNPQGGAGTDGLPGGFGQAGVGAFYRNSRIRFADVTDGL